MIGEDGDLLDELIEPHHKTVFIDRMWKIGEAINQHHYIEMQYKGVQGKHGHTRKIKPVAIMFSDFYFYLAAFIDDEEVKKNFDIINDANPTIYRIDRMQDFKVKEYKRQKSEQQAFAEKKRDLMQLLGSLMDRLYQMKISYRPTEEQDSTWSPVFSFAVNKYEYTAYLYDYVLFESTDSQLKNELEDLMQEVEKIERDYDIISG